MQNEDFITMEDFISVPEDSGESISIEDYIYVSSDDEEEINIVDIGREDAEDKNKKKEVLISNAVKNAKKGAYNNEKGNSDNSNKRDGRKQFNGPDENKMEKNLDTIGQNYILYKN